VAPAVVGVGRPGPAVEQVHAAGAFAEVAPERLLAGHEQHVAVVGFVELVANAFPHAAEAGLVYVSDVEPGIRRRRAGK